MTYDEVLGEYIIARDVARACYSAAHDIYETGPRDDDFQFDDYINEGMAQVMRMRFLGAYIADGVLKECMWRLS